MSDASRRPRVELQTAPQCPHCHEELSLRQNRHPALLTLAFGVSFAIFLFFADSFVSQPWILWTWSLSQVVLGFFLIRARLGAKKKVYRCLSCTP